MAITAFYAALLTPLYVLLSLRVIGARRRQRVPVGDGGNATVLRRMRVQANFAENVPWALLLMALTESLSADARLLHSLGVALLVGRIVHAVGMSREMENLALRVFGMAATFSVQLVAAAACLVLAVQRLY